MHKGCLIPLIIISALAAFAFTQSWVESNRATYYENSEDFSLDELPASAHDIRFVGTAPFSPWGRAYEFKCSEEDYRLWVARTRKEHPKLSEIREESRAYAPKISKEGKIKDETVTGVLISDWTFEDQGFYLVYDKKDGRAIRWSHSR